MATDVARGVSTVRVLVEESNEMKLGSALLSEREAERKTPVAQELGSHVT